jgi:preprotein translocase subunit SecG
MLSGLLTALLILVALVMIVLVIVLQQGNEGGIGTAFGSGNSAGFFGASGGVTLIVRATWICGALFFGISTTLAWVKTHQHFGVSREIDDVLKNNPPASKTAPAAAAAPATGAAPAASAPTTSVPAAEPSAASPK